MQQPDRKVQIGAGMGSLAAVGAYAIQAYTGQPIPAEIAIAASTFLSFIAHHVHINIKTDERK